MYVLATKLSTNITIVSH